MAVARQFHNNAGFISSVGTEAVISYAAAVSKNTIQPSNPTSPSPQGFFSRWLHMFGFGAPAEKISNEDCEEKQDANEFEPWEEVVACHRDTNALKTVTYYECNDEKYRDDEDYNDNEYKEEHKELIKAIENMTKKAFERQQEEKRKKREKEQQEKEQEKEQIMLSKSALRRKKRREKTRYCYA